MRLSSTSAKRWGVSLVAAAAVSAGLPSLLSSPAYAGPASRLTVSGPAHQAAGTCQLYTVNVQDAFGAQATDSGKITVRLTEQPSTDAQDIDFCTPSPFVTAYAVPPHYRNAPSLAGGTYPGATDQTYQPRATVCPSSAVDDCNNNTVAANDNPDRASASGADNPSRDNNNNPGGLDIAQFDYSQSTQGQVVFGVVGLVPGDGAIDAFKDMDADQSYDSGDADPSKNDLAAPRYSLHFTDGGPPDSPQAADAVRSVSATCATEFGHCWGSAKESYGAAGGSAHQFNVVLSNASGDAVGGVVPRIAPSSGPNTNSFYTAQCTRSDNAGRAVCAFRGNTPGTDILAIYVNQTGADATGGMDTSEPRDTVVAHTSAAPSPAGAGRYIDLTPDRASTTPGGSSRFIALVTDANGAPVVDLPLTFSESGPGTISGGAADASNGTSTVQLKTDETGRAGVLIPTTASENGDELVTARFSNPAVTPCGDTGGAPARCADTSVNTVGTVSPSPTPTQSSSSPTPTPTQSSSTPTPSQSTNNSPPPVECTSAVTTLSQESIVAGRAGTMTVRATPNSIIEVYAYSQPSTTFRVVRSAELGGEGLATFTITPPTNTRLYAQQQGCQAGNQVVQQVRTGLSLSARRIGVRTYVFSGDSLPARPGGLIVSLYRVSADGSETLAGQVRANSSNGTWSLTRKFTGSGRFSFVARTGRDLQNAPGVSNTRPTIIY